MDKENVDPGLCGLKEKSHEKKYVMGENSIFKNALSTPGLDPSQLSEGALKSLTGPPPSDSDSDDDNDESARVRKALEAERAKKDPTFDPWDAKFAKVRYTSSGKPIVRKTKPFNVWAANTWGYLRYQDPPAKKAKKEDANNGDEVATEEDDIGLHTIAYPELVRSLKEDIAKELQKNGKFELSVNDAFRKKYYIEIPYCRWCDTRPCACFVN